MLPVKSTGVMNIFFSFSAAIRSLKKHHENHGAILLNKCVQLL